MDKHNTFTLSCRVVVSSGVYVGFVGTNKDIDLETYTYGFVK